jgi:subtilase family serine protease
MLWTLGVLVLALPPVLAVAPAAAQVIVTHRAAPIRTVNLAKGFHEFLLAHHETSQNVCSYDVSMGQAHCNAQLRTDAAAALQLPRPGRTTTATSTLGDDGAYSPSYLESAYNVASLAAQNSGGVGRTVAVIDAYDDPNLYSDLSYYRSYFGLPACPSGAVTTSATGCVFEKVNETGAPTPLPSANSSWGVETSLDVEMVSAICPSCEILVIEASSASIADLGTSVNTAVSLGADVVSNSYGAREFQGEQSDDAAYFDHPGVPIVASSGDSGYGVEYPAASTDVVAVGGTTLNQLTDSGTRDATESAWSGAGAGCSAYEAKPAWQHDSNCSKRTVADVAADADPSTGVWVFDTYGASGFAIYGGTSVAAPIISSIFALSQNSQSTANDPAQYLYADPSALTAITSGSDGNCGTYLCNAADSQNGYNGPTGLGSPGGTPDSSAAFAPSTQATSPTAPNAPTLTSATAAGTSVTLTWSASSSGSAATGFNVYEGTSANGESSTPTNSSPLSGLSTTLSGLTSGTTYFFVVRAVNDAGASNASNELSVTVATSPGGPTDVTATRSKMAGVQLSWRAPASNGGSPVTGYEILRSTTSGMESDYATVTCGSTTCELRDTNTTSGVTYYYEVAAVNDVGVGPLSPQVSAVAR